MHLSTYKHGPDVTVVMLTGDLDAQAAESFREQYEAQVPDDAGKVIIDCGKLASVSSMGLGMLMRVQSQMKESGGQIKLANVPSVIAGVLQVVHLDKVFGLYPTVDAAYRDFH